MCLHQHALFSIILKSLWVLFLSLYLLRADHFMFFTNRFIFSSWPQLKPKCQSALVESFIWCHTGACRTAKMNASSFSLNLPALTFHFQTRVHLNDYEKKSQNIYQARREQRKASVLMVHHYLHITGVNNNFRV